MAPMMPIPGNFNIPSWSTLLALLLPDLLILDTDDLMRFDNAERFDQPRSLIHYNASSLNKDGVIAGTQLVEYLNKTTGLNPAVKKIFIKSTLADTVSLLQKVSIAQLAHWQFHWIIVVDKTEDEPFNVAQNLSRFKDEWQFALVQLEKGSYIPGNLTDGETSHDSADFNTFYVYSLHPRHNMNKPGMTRVPELQAVINHSDQASILKSPLRNQLRTINISDYKAYAALQQSLFSDPLDSYKNFNGRVVTTTGVHYPPWLSVWNPECKTISDLECIPRSGIDLSLLGTISKALNFSLRVVLVADGQWGIPKPDGSFTGMIGDVHQRRADISACDITINRIRRAVVDFSYPYYFESLRFLTSAPGELSRAFVVLKPFGILVWALVALATTFTVFMLKFLQKAEEAIKGPPTKKVQGGKVIPEPTWSLTDYTFQTVQHLTGAGDPMPSHEAFQVYLIFWLMCALVLGIFCCNDIYEYITSVYIPFLGSLLIGIYSGLLTAYMTSPDQAPGIEHLEDLKAATSSGLLYWGLPKGTASVSLFKTAESGIYHDLWKNLLKYGEDKSMVESDADGIQKVLDSNYAYVSETIILQKSIAEKGRDKFHLSRDGFSPNSYGIVLQKGSPFKPVFDRRVLQILSGGLVRKWSSDAIDEAAQRAMSSENGNSGGGESKEALKLEHLQGAFIVLCLGYGCSILSFIGEWAYCKKRIRCCWE